MLLASSHDRPELVVGGVESLPPMAPRNSVEHILVLVVQGVIKDLRHGHHGLVQLRAVVGDVLQGVVRDLRMQRRTAEAAVPNNAAHLCGEGDERVREHPVLHPDAFGMHDRYC